MLGDGQDAFRGIHGSALGFQHRVLQRGAQCGQFGLGAGNVALGSKGGATDVVHRALQEGARVGLRGQGEDLVPLTESFQRHQLHGDVAHRLTAVQLLGSGGRHHRSGDRQGLCEVALQHASPLDEHAGVATVIGGGQEVGAIGGQDAVAPLFDEVFIGDHGALVGGDGVGIAAQPHEDVAGHVRHVADLRRQWLQRIRRGFGAYRLARGLHQVHVQMGQPRVVAVFAHARFHDLHGQLGVRARRAVPLEVIPGRGHHDGVAEQEGDLEVLRIFIVSGLGGGDDRLAAGGLIGIGRHVEHRRQRLDHVFPILRLIGRQLHGTVHRLLAFTHGVVGHGAVAAVGVGAEGLRARPVDAGIVGVEAERGVVRANRLREVITVGQTQALIEEVLRLLIRRIDGAAEVAGALDEHGIFGGAGLHLGSCGLQRGG